MYELDESRNTYRILVGNFIYSGRLEERWVLRIRMDVRWKEQAQGCGKWRVFSLWQGRIYHEANEAEASGPVTCTDPFQDPGRDLAMP